MHRAVFEALTDLSRDPLWFVDPAGLLVTCNSAFERWWKQLTDSTPAPGALLDAPFPELDDIQRRALQGRSIMANVRVIVGGIERTYTVDARPLDREGVAFTAREAAAEDGNQRDAEPALLHLFASDEPFDDLLTKTLAFLCTSEEWDAAALWRVDGETLRVQTTWADLPATQEKLASRIAGITLRRGEGPPGRAWLSGEVVWIPDMLDESTHSRAEAGAAAGLRSLVATPLFDGQRVIGVLELFARSVRPINEVTRRGLGRTGGALARMIERRSLIEQIARKGAEWLLTVDTINMPILLVGPDHRIVRVNRMAHELAGLDYNQLVGRPLTSIGEGEPWTTLASVVDAVRERGITCTAETTAGLRTWDISASPLNAPRGDDDRVVITMRETTELVHLQQEVRRGEQLALMGELVAGVAHEVKNPLFGMTVMLDLLDQQLGDRAAEIAETTGALRKWIGRLQSLTENLLAYGRTWTLELVPGRLDELLPQAVKSIEPLAQDAQVSIAADIQLSSPPVLMDASRLILVFENLLANAIQHSRAGEEVSIRLRRDGGHMEVVVRDRGPGFKADEIPRIFQPFFTRRRGGTGLGLSVVQRITGEHGGTVTAANAPDGGAVVRVRFPLYSEPQ